MTGGPLAMRLFFNMERSKELLMLIPVLITIQIPVRLSETPGHPPPLYPFIDSSLPLSPPLIGERYLMGYPIPSLEVSKESVSLLGFRLGPWIYKTVALRHRAKVLHTRVLIFRYTEFGTLMEKTEQVLQRYSSIGPRASRKARWESEFCTAFFFDSGRRIRVELQQGAPRCPEGGSLVTFAIQYISTASPSLGCIIFHRLFQNLHIICDQNVCQDKTNDPKHVGFILFSLGVPMAKVAIETIASSMVPYHCMSCIKDMLLIYPVSFEGIKPGGAVDQFCKLKTTQSMSSRRQNDVKVRRICRGAPSVDAVD
ncbi:hypothetical protein EVAR_103192_1 [Eumeta japonica]|uniref:Uncharacterized protein n=1 Tax=Eumeta variegata TaxID=151549 RepID=A0A4C1YFC1_EUMVA|nr:hypothetical protein EVAR_103192_1 [Eumeta japonica]